MNTNNKLKYIYYYVVPFLVILIISYWIAGDLLFWKEKIFLGGDYLGLSNWAKYFSDSLIIFKQFPTWSFLWGGGMPFFGLVPFGLYFFTLIPCLIFGSLGGVYITTFIFFALAGVFMYLYLYNVTKEVFPALLGAIFYTIIPVHTGSMLTIGLMDITICLSLVPLVMLSIDILFERKKPYILFLVILLLSVFLLVQIEFSIMSFIFLIVPYLVYKIIKEYSNFKEITISFFIKNTAWVIASIIVISVPITFYLTSLIQQNNFSFHSESTVERGRKFYSYTNISDIITQKASTAEDIFLNPKTEYYLGLAPLIMILFLIIYTIFLNKKIDKNERLIIYLLVPASIIFFLACFYNYPVFNFIIKCIPILEKIRIPFRFYYYFIFLFTILFSLSLKYLTKISTTYFSQIKNGQHITKIIIFLIILGLLFYSYYPYFSFYKYRSVVPDNFIPCPEIYDTVFSNGNKQARVWDSPESVEYCTKNEKNSQFQTVHSWLSWTDYYANNDFVDKLTTGNANRSFLFSLFGVDYNILYYTNIMPAEKIKLPNRYDTSKKNLEKDKSFSIIKDINNDKYSLTVFKNNDVMSKFYLYPLDNVVFISPESGEKTSYEQLAQYYNLVKSKVSRADFIKHVIITSDKSIHSLMDPSNKEEITNTIKGFDYSKTTENDYKLGDINYDSRGMNITIENNLNGIFFINYFDSPWWEIKVNGNKAQKLNIDGVFIGIKLDKGINKIELKYNYPYIKYITISLSIDLAIALIYIVIINSRKIYFESRKIFQPFFKNKKDS